MSSCRPSFETCSSVITRIETALVEGSMASPLGAVGLVAHGPVPVSLQQGFGPGRS
jgi:hypothetical protein